jgi:hypothetical protein
MFGARFLSGKLFPPFAINNFLGGVSINSFLGIWKKIPDYFLLMILKAL